MTTLTATVEHAAVMVSDIDAAVAWYSENLGLPVLDRWEDADARMAWAHLGDATHRIEFIQREDLAPRPDAVSGLHHLAFVVPDCAAAVQALREAGAAPVTEPAPFARHRMVWAFVRDPFGNTIELVSYPDEPTHVPAREAGSHPESRRQHAAETAR